MYVYCTDVTDTYTHTHVFIKIKKCKFLFWVEAKGMANIFLGTGKGNVLVTLSPPSVTVTVLKGENIVKYLRFQSMVSNCCTLWLYTYSLELAKKSKFILPPIKASIIQ